MEIKYELIIGIKILLAIFVQSEGGRIGHSKETEYFDLGYSFNEDTIYYPGGKDFILSKDRQGLNPTYGFWYASYSFCMGEHGGTHLDAPYHFDQNGWTVDKIPPSRLIDVSARVIDVSEDVFHLSNASEFIMEVSHLLEYEKKFGRIPAESLILVHTGWSRFWPDKIKYLGWDNQTSTSEFILNFPGISLSAAKWLVNERNIVGIGIDTASVDPGTRQDYPVHQFLGEKQIYVLENVANLHLLVARSKESSSCKLSAFVLPLKIVGGTGSPTRILAYCKHENLRRTPDIFEENFRTVDLQ